MPGEEVGIAGLALAGGGLGRVALREAEMYLLDARNIQKAVRVGVFYDVGLLVLGGVVKKWFGPETLAVPAAQTKKK